MSARGDSMLASMLVGVRVLELRRQSMAKSEAPVRKSKQHPKMRRLSGTLSADSPSSAGSSTSFANRAFGPFIERKCGAFTTSSPQSTTLVDARSAGASDPHPGVLGSLPPSSMPWVSSHDWPVAPSKRVLLMIGCLLRCCPPAHASECMCRRASGFHPPAVAPHPEGPPQLGHFRFFCIACS